eukprot:Blabericola_migrator_1__7648@NODE_3903_length_1437_cov_166_178832_g97_i1_p2_GENE_NODE_3903_length_1437_cov_166_178832_g97_i1NODE_3903_length_1437_cov_166_178832_g97_i1_p2_ORF_typecomplete_len102_score13_69_NODE_3903_length_1437_cov_166_178832_g97_i122306
MAATPYFQRCLILSVSEDERESTRLERNTEWNQRIPRPPQSPFSNAVNVDISAALTSLSLVSLCQPAPHSIHRRNAAAPFQSNAPLHSELSQCI